jgi:hypothetical protein
MSESVPLPEADRVSEWSGWKAVESGRSSASHQGAGETVPRLGARHERKCRLGAAREFLHFHQGATATRLQFTNFQCLSARLNHSPTCNGESRGQRSTT